MVVCTDIKTVFICDDETPVRISVKFFMERYDWLNPIGSGATPDECIEQIGALKPDIATVDIFMRSKQDGFRTCEGIARVSPDTRMVAYSAFFDQSLTTALSEVGVLGFVDKGSEMEDLVDAARAVSEGAIYSCPRLTTRLAQWSISTRADNPKTHTFVPLSPSQTEILKDIVLGYTSDEIAVRLSVEPCTVRTQRRRLMQKFGVRNVAQMIEAAYRYGYIR
ncbi:MAG: DNA-binding NarL/FixJ family response regulator [Candidatus Promineifilaceae bacterium]|jgi:DNA-binding NarL/FixJ family response regulator